MPSIAEIRRLLLSRRSLLIASRYIDDLLILVLFAACWIITFFTANAYQTTPSAWLIRIDAPDSTQVGPMALGRFLSLLALGAVVVFWTFRPAFRPGWRPRDLLIVLLAGLFAGQDLTSPIRSLAMNDLLFTLELAALLIVALYLALSRPQALLATVLALLVLALALTASRDWLARGFALKPDEWRSLFPFVDSVRLGEITLLVALASLPWFLPRRILPYQQQYQWLVFGVIGCVLVLEATGLWLNDGNWVRRMGEAFPSETRHFVRRALWSFGIFGCGPHHYEWLFKAHVPSDFASQTALTPGFVILLLERGLIGLIAWLGFAAAMLWTFAPGRWAREHEDVLEMAQPLRFVTAYVVFISLATPALRSAFGQLLIWVLFGILRSFSSKRPPRAIGVVKPTAALAIEPHQPIFTGGPWSSPQVFMVIGTLLVGLGLSALHLAPWIASRYRIPPASAPSPKPAADVTPPYLRDPEFLRRLEMARHIWSYDPRIYTLRAAWYRAQENIGQKPDLLAIVTRSYRRVIYLNPYDPVNHVGLARWFVVQNRLDDAMQAVRVGLQYAPASLLLRLWLATLQIRQDQILDAVETLERAHQLYPRSTRVLLMLADVHERQNHFREAEYYLGIVLQIDPRNKTALEKLREMNGQ